MKKQREAIMNDSIRKELFKSLFDLYANSLPMIDKKGNGEIVVSYSDEVENMADEIRIKIIQRDNQIFNETL